MKLLTAKGHQRIREFADSCCCTEQCCKMVHRYLFGSMNSLYCDVLPQSASCSLESWSQTPAEHFRLLGGPQRIERGRKWAGNEVNIGTVETLIVVHKMFAYILNFPVYPHRMGNNLFEGHRWLGKEVAPANFISLRKSWIFFGRSVVDGIRFHRLHANFLDRWNNN